MVPGTEKILITPPTYGMYAVCAQVNDVGVVKCALELGGEKGEGGLEGRFSLRISEVRNFIYLVPEHALNTDIPSILRVSDFEDHKGYRC